MNERSRRQHQTRRHHQVAQPSNQHHRNNRSIYHGNSPDTYPASNYRHTSTTTTTTDPPSIGASRSERDCEISIFYSYLIAIVSSFLVVLGIYLSLTRFNVHFLYISLTGLSIEAISACIYCVSNIHASKLDRRKQRFNSDDLILNSSNIAHHNIDSNRQHQITTHILSNSTLTSTNNNDIIPILNENNPSAITNNNDVQPLQPIQQTTEAQSSQGTIVNANTPSAEALTASDAISDATNSTRLNGQRDQLDTGTGPVSLMPGAAFDQLPKSFRSSQQSPEATSSEFVSSSTNLLEQERSPRQDVDLCRVNNGNANPPTSEDPTSSQLSINMVSQFNRNLGDNLNKSNATDSGQSRIVHHSGVSVKTEPEGSAEAELLSPANPLDTFVSEPGLSQSPSDNSDLINLQQPIVGLVTTEIGAAEPQARRRSSHGQQRPANLRRTLVMGLSGEEEVIEIDEEDLDNMSILPPSYESITATK